MRRLDDDWLAHDGRNGATHLLDPMAGGLLAALLARPGVAMDTVQLEEALRPPTADASDIDTVQWTFAIERCLRALAAAGLAAPARIR